MFSLNTTLTFTLPSLRWRYKTVRFIKHSFLLSICEHKLVKIQLYNAIISHKKDKAPNGALFITIIICITAVMSEF